MIVGLHALRPVGPPIAERGLSVWRDSVFASFTDIPNSFRRTLRECGGVFSGSFLIKALERRTSSFPLWTPGLHDFFLPATTFESFCDFLLSRCHGTVIDTITIDPPSVAFDRMVSEKRIIDTTRATFSVYKATALCPLLAVATSYADIQFTFMSADTLCIAYPWSVFRKEIAIQPEGARNPFHLRRIMNSYRSRGYSPVSRRDSGQHSCRQEGMCPRVTRRFGDNYCLTIHFPDPSAPDATLAPNTRNTFPTASWSFGGPPCGNAACMVQVRCHVDCVYGTTSTTQALY